MVQDAHERMVSSLSRLPKESLMWLDYEQRRGGSLRGPFLLFLLFLLRFQGCLFCKGDFVTCFGVSVASVFSVDAFEPTSFSLLVPLGFLFSSLCNVWRSQLVSTSQTRLAGLVEPYRKTQRRNDVPGEIPLTQTRLFDTKHRPLSLTPTSMCNKKKGAWTIPSRERHAWRQRTKHKNGNLQTARLPRKRKDTWWRRSQRQKACKEMRSHEKEHLFSYDWGGGGICRMRVKERR